MRAYVVTGPVQASVTTVADPVPAVVGSACFDQLVLARRSASEMAQAALMSPMWLKACG